MNGFSLLLLLSSLGATAGIETGLNGQPIYAIRIEPLLINELRNGQTIPIVVAPKDRGLRQFKIAVEGGASLRSGARTNDFNSRAGELFDYEPTQLPDGEIEYVVQISPERLASLEAGRAIEGSIAADIPEVHRFLIFVGIGQLPSQQEAAARQQPVTPVSNTSPPSLIRGADGRASAATNQARTPVSKSAFPASSTATNQPAAGIQRGFQTADPLAQFNAPTAGTRTIWRNQPDQSTINPPPFAGAQNSSTGTIPRTAGIPSVTDRNGYATQPNYNNQYQQPPYGDPNSGYAQANQSTYPQQGYPSNPPLGYQQSPVAMTAARNDLPQANATQQMPPTSNWSQPQPATQPVSQPVAAATQPVTLASSSSKNEIERDRPWTPLILTTLALFASLGANAYLGWLAWSFFWRFRDAVTESARTRAQISSSRQAA